MTIDETKQIMTILKTAYPQFYKGQSVDEMKQAILLWQNLFADDDAVNVAMAVKSFIATDTKGFPPVIGVIKDMLIKLTTPEQMSEMEAWNLVTKAMRNPTQETYDKLPPILQRILGSVSILRQWASMDTETVQSVIQSNFMRSYKVKSQSAKEFLALPKEIQVMSEKLTGKFEMPKLTEFERNEINETTKR